jgi:hypothetical protein
MSVFSIKLDKLQLISSAERLELSVDASLSLTSSHGNFQTLSSTQLLDLLSSGKVWVYRGKGCCMTFTILQNGSRIDKGCNGKVVEDLGHYLQKAPVSSGTLYDWGSAR